MAHTKQKGDIGEAKILAELLERGYKVARPVGEDWPYDLIVLRKGKLLRVQCKYTRSNGEVVEVACRSCNNHSVYQYTSREVDWIAVYDATTQKCFFVSSKLLGAGRNTMLLRLTPAKNGQTRGVRPASRYEKF